jgi:hypothetical protein
LAIRSSWSAWRAWSAGGSPHAMISGRTELIAQRSRADAIAAASSSIAALAIASARVSRRASDSSASIAAPRPHRPELVIVAFLRRSVRLVAEPRPRARRIDGSTRFLCPPVTTADREPRHPAALYDG